MQVDEKQRDICDGRKNEQKSCDVMKLEYRSDER